MLCEQNGALEKFLATPELVEMLLPFLNAKDILHLVQSGMISIKILQSPFVWKRFIRRSAPSNKKDMDGNVDNDANRQKAVLAPIVDILRMMKGQKSPERDLLNLICERFSSKKRSKSQYVVLRCCSKQTKRISPLGFVLLEMVEGALGSTWQQVKKIRMDGWSGSGQLQQDWLSSLSTRASRQRGSVQRLDIGVIMVNDKNLDEFINLMNQSQFVIIASLQICDYFQVQSDWSKLRRTLNDKVMLFQVAAHREYLVKAQREDLRAIWNYTFTDLEDALGNWCVAWYISDHPKHGEIFGDVTFEKNIGESEWERLEKFLDMSKEEYYACVQPY